MTEKNQINLNFSRLVINNSKKSKTFCDSYLYEPVREKAPFGKMLMVIKIEDSLDIADKLSNIILSSFQERYYYNFSRKFGVLENFEKALNKVNNNLADFAKGEQVDWVSKLNCLIAIIKEEEMHFTLTGSVQVLLFRDKQVIDIGQELLKGKSPSAMRIFTDIVSGAVKENDRILFTTPELFDYFSNEKVKNTILKYSPEAAVLHLQDSIDAEDVFNIASLCVEIVKSKPAFSFTKQTKPFKNGQKPQKREKTQKEGLGKLDFPNLEELSEKPFKDGLKDFTKSRLSSILLKAKDRFESRKKKFETERKIEENIKIKKTGTSKGEPKTNIFQKSKDLLKGLKAYINEFLINFKRLPASSKVFFVTFIIFTVLFMGSVIGLTCKRKETKTTKQHEELLLQAQEKEKAASDALIYNDEKNARILLEEASNLTNQLVELGVFEKEAKDLNEKIQQQLDRVNHIIRIKEPITLATKENIGGIFYLEGNLYSFDYKTNSIYQLDEAEKRLVTISSESFNLGHFIKGVSNPENNSIIFYSDAPSVVEFKPKESKLNQLDIEFAASNQDIKDVGIYNKNIYFLDVKNNQIYKHARTIGGFSSGKAWFKESVDLSGVVSMAIDSYVYLIKSDGLILKYLSGSQKEFILEELTIPLDSASKIFTALDYNYLYILDPKNSRILILDKKGSLKNQYISDSFDDLKDIYVDEASKKMYVLNGNKIFGLVLE